MLIVVGLVLPIVAIVGYRAIAAANCRGSAQALDFYGAGLSAVFHERLQARVRLGIAEGGSELLGFE